MDSQTIRTALGRLQAEPGSEEAWNALQSSAAARDGDLSPDELLRLIEAASDKHAERGEWFAVSRLLELATTLPSGDARENELLRRHARVAREQLFDEDLASKLEARILESNPGDEQARQAQSERAERRARYAELRESYLSEADAASDDVYKSSMLMRAAEMDVRFGSDAAAIEAAIDRLEQAVRLDPTNEGAGRLLEHVYRQRGRHEDLAGVLERLSDRGETAASRVSAGVRLARVYAQNLGDNERAARAYDRVLRDAPEHAEAKAYLSDLYSGAERWSDLVALYEREVRAKGTSDAERVGDMLQIAMLHWKKLERPQDAEPWFERIRKVEPANPSMLAFFREFYANINDDTRLMDVLQNAARALPEGSKERTSIGAELGKLAEGQANAQKAIEQYKSVLRQDPDNVEAREALKRLYKQTQGFNALVELLRQELERLPNENYPARVAVLREVATVYRQYIKSDTALLSVLGQIVQLDDKLDEHDVLEMRELVTLYEKLGRHRDLISNQMKLAEITPDLEEKKALYRSAGRRWLEQFSNAQNATEAYAALYRLAPDDREARERLEELYRKRRAWAPLYDLYAADLENADGGKKLSLLREMAQLAAERLNRPAEALKLYQQTLELDPSRIDALDALEKLAERSRDFATLAHALEKRIELVSDEAGKLAALQKLGAVYAEQLQDQPRAVSTWRRVLALSPGHSRALRVLRESYLSSGDFDALEELYGSQNDWEGLAEVLSTAADRAKDNASRITLSYRAARIYEEKLAQPERAFRSYDRILSVDPTDTRAARALVPLYEKDEKWARLTPLYELLYEKADGDQEKLELLGKLVEISGRRLGDRKTAVAYARKAYELAPDSQFSLDLLEETSRAAGAWEAFVEVLESRLASTPAAESETQAAKTEAAATGKKGKKKKKPEPEPEAAVEPAKPASEDPRRKLELKLARVYSEELSRTDDAVNVYKHMLERDSSDPEAAAELESILRRYDRRDDLRWLLDLRVVSAADDERLRLLSDWATLEETVFEAPERAASLYRRMLELDPASEPALAALPRLLLAAGDASGAAEILARHRDVASGEARAEREVELAELYLEKLQQSERALESAIAALASDVHAARAMSVLERLVNVEGVRARAADVLAQRYAAGGEARREATALNVLLEQVQDPAERLSLYQRLADVNEHKLGAHGSALDVTLTAVREFPAELSLWDRADALATTAGRPTDLAEALREVLRTKHEPALECELSERAARLHEERLGDPIGATPYLERVLALSPGNELAFQRLKDILTAAERWGELEALYDRASRATDDLSRRTEMLVEVALICEEIIEDAPKATAYYERILEIDPVNDAAIRALDRLYQRQGLKRELSLLLDKRLETAVGDDAFELKLRLAKLQLDLLQPERAIGHVEDVLRERINDYEARELAERMLSIGELRPRAARALETVYESRDEVRDLVRVLSIRLESLAPGESTDERRELLRRIALLRDDRLHDDEAALAALSELVPMDPLDTDARARLQEIGRRVSAHERVASVLVTAAEKADTPALRGDILTGVARIYEEQLADSVRAEAVYRQVAELDPADAELVLPAARALERIYAESGDNAKLAEMLRLQVKHEHEGAKRRELLGRLGMLSETVLGDQAGAIAAWSSRVEENPDDAEALAALDKLYESAGRYRELVSVLQRRREGTTDPELRRSLLTREAEVLWKKLDSVNEAIDAYQSLVSEFGASRESLTALEALFGAARRYEDLAEAYERHLDLCENDDERLELLAKLGDIKRERLAEASSAVEVYRRALDIRSSHPESRAAVAKLLEDDDPVIRREAALILKPIYQAEGDSESLLKALLIEVDTSDDPLDKLRGLEEGMKVAERPLGDSQRAFGLAQRAVRSALGHADLVPWFGHLERLAIATSRQAEYVKLLAEVVPEIFDGDVQLLVTLKIADLARHQLADRELARDYYKKALELRAEDKRALSALESLYEEGGDARSLLEILERRTEVAESDEERKALLFRRARLLADVLGERRRGIEVYETILDLGLEREALTALEQLYTTEQLWPELVRLYERQLDERLGDPASLHVAIARIAARHQHDIGRAFDELELALAAERQHEGAIGELERLMLEASEPSERGRAATLLEPVYLRRADYGRVMDSIRARLEASGDPDERRELLTRLAKLYEEQKEDYRAALDTVARLLAEDPSDSGTISELERLAKVASAEQRLAEIYAGELAKIEHDDEHSARIARRTGELFRELGQTERALEFFRRALAFEPESKALFEAVDGLLEQSGRADERVALYRQALEHRFEPAERLQLLHTMASLQRSKLATPDEAIETYRQALEVADDDAVALDALTELYRERERWDDLAELFLRRAENAQSPEARAQYRLALARLHQEQGEVDRAIDQLQEIVTVSPGHSEALAALEQLRKSPDHTERVVEILRPLYESLDDWRRQIHLNEDRYKLAQHLADKVAVLRETAELWEKRGDDLNRARRALEAAVKLDPDDADTRAQYERLTERTGAWDQLSEAYEVVLAEHAELGDRREILARLAEVHNRRRDDPRRALSAYERLYAADESDIEPLNEMERLATLLSDWTTLVRVLTAKAELVPSDEERASVWRRVAEAKRDMLDDSAGAIAGYEKALELEPSSSFTVDCLIDLYEARGDAARLVELYLQRVELSDEEDVDLKYTLLVSAAACYDQQLADKRKAIEVLERALSVRPGDAGVLASLNRLYRAEAMWPELLDSLKQQAESTATAEERASLRKQIGGILAAKLDSHEEALEAYRLALGEAPGDGELIAAVRGIGQSHEDLRGSVAEILVPVLESSARHAELCDVLELRLSIETEPSERVQTLRTIARVLEQRLADPGKAEAALLRAINERPDDLELHTEIERLAAASGGFARYADALSDRAQSTFDPEVARELYVRLGRIAEQELKDDQRAVLAYKRAVEQAGDQPELLDALDRLYTRLGDHEAVAEILERRVSVEASDERQADSYFRLAELQLAQFREPERALGSLRMALERVPGHEAAIRELEKLLDVPDLFEEVSELLESVYRSRGMTERLPKLFERRIGFADSVEARVDMRRSLARVLEQDCADARAAQRVIELGLSEAPSDTALLEELERLATATGEWDKACAALSAALSSNMELAPEVGVSLTMRLAEWYRERAGDPAAAEAALAQALSFDESSDELLSAIEQLQQRPGRELDLLATLRRRAKLQVDDARRDELYRRAKELAESQGDSTTAEAVLRELLAQDDTNLWALGELFRLREQAGDYHETFKLTVRQAELEPDANRVRQLRRRAAEIARDQLKDVGRATQLFEQLFEDDPQDTEAAAALRALYPLAGRDQELGRLLERLIDMAEAPAARTRLRLELAELNRRKFSAPEAAIDLLRAVLEEEPGQSEAVVALSELLEETKRDEELAELLTTQIAAARQRSDVASELRYQVRLGEVYDARLGDRARAIATYRGVLERDAQHGGALEALARLYKAQGELAGAAEILGRSLELASGPAAVSLALELADVEQQLGSAERAARALERALSQDPQNPELRERLRTSYRASSDWEKLSALLARDAELAAGPDALRLYREAARIQSQQRGDHAAAAELLERASRLKPDDREILLELCDQYSASGRGKAAAEVLQRIVESFGTKRTKELGEIHRRLASAYLADGEVPRALEELDKAFRIEPGNVQVLTLLGDVALQVGDLKKAQQMYRALLLQKLDENASPIKKSMVFFRLGQIHEKLDEKPKAVQMYERAVQTDGLEEARARLSELKG